MGPFLLTTGGLIMSRLLLTLMVCAAFLTSACGKSQPQQSAFYNREQVVQQHADYAELEAGRQRYAQLLDQQQVYQERFRVQLSCLQDLQQLQALSRADYSAADIQTQVAEYAAREEYNLDKYYKVLDQRVEEAYGPSRAALEAQAKNELFNLRLKLQVMSLTPEKRALLEEEYIATRGAREADLETWKQSRQNYYQQELANYYRAREERIYTREQELRSQSGLLPRRALSFTDQLVSAPAYIRKIFIALDDKLVRQQVANEQLEETINRDIEQALQRLQPGYSSIQEKTSQQGQAVDITQAVIQEIQKNKKK